MTIATVTINDVELSVSYTWTPFEPATRHSPAEGGDIEYHGIYINGDNVDCMLAEWVHDKIDAAVNADIDQRKRDAAEDRAMAMAA